MRDVKSKNKFLPFTICLWDIRSVISTVPFAAVYVLLYLMLSSLSGSIISLLIEKLTDSVLSGNAVFLNNILFYIAFYVVTQLLSFGYAIAMNTFVFEKVTSEMNRRLSMKMLDIEYFSVENEKELNKIYKSRECINEERVSDTFICIISICSILTAIISSFAIAMKWSFILPFILLFCYIPETVVRNKAVKEENAEKDKLLPLEREKTDLWKVFFRKESAKEIRIFQTGKFLEEKWKRQNISLYSNLWNIKNNGMKKVFGARLLRMLGLVGCMIIISIKCVRGELLAGAMAGAIALLPSVQDLFSTLGNRYYRLKQNMPYLRSLFLFLKQNNHNHSCTLTIKDRIRVKDVSFRYDERQEVLSHISFEISQGEKIAVVGENGAGKSTLIKCLLGMYPLEKGSVEYDNICLKKGEKYDYDNISIMLHEFGKYSMKVSENIAFEKAVPGMVEEVGLEDIMLGKEFGGTELSGGEWQRIALARCLKKNAEFYILDEPTSQLDPVYERDVVRSILDYLEKKTVLIVTHRMGICRFVDKVIVLNKAHEIAGIGKHEELMETCETYRELYTNQAQWYLDGEIYG